MLTDEEIIERWKLSCLCGGVSAITTAKMVRNFYEARLAEDAKVRAQLFHALDNLYAMVNSECPSLLENDHHDDMVRAALAAAKVLE